MYRCPHCRRPTFSWPDKVRASSTRPAICKACGGLAHVGTLWHLRPGLAATGIAAVGLTVAAWHESGIVLALTALAYLAVYAHGFHREPLRPTSPAQVAAGRSYAWGLPAVVLLVLGLLLAVSGRG